MTKKYEFTGETKDWCGITLKQIRAVRDFTLKSGIKVTKGDLGGWIEKEENLSHTDSAWVYGDAKVFGDAQVCGDAKVYGDAMVYGNARIGGDASIEKSSDVIWFRNNWSSGRTFTYTRSNGKWTVGCFHGTGEELIKKAYADSEVSGKCYETIVRATEEIYKAIENEEVEK